jgi:hypothetical protein
MPINRSRSRTGQFTWPRFVCKDVLDHQWRGDQLEEVIELPAKVFNLKNNLGDLMAFSAFLRMRMIDFGDHAIMRYME